MLDCPGHMNYITNMIRGATQADVACLVISARPGEFEAGFEKSGGTKEHLLIAKILGAQRFVFVINKMDLVGWAQQTFLDIKAKVESYIKELPFEFDMNDFFWVPVSGLMNLNIRERVGEQLCPWYKGHSLIDQIDAMDPLFRKMVPVLRMPIFDTLQTSQQGLNVFVKVETGIVKQYMECMLVPSYQIVKISQIRDHNDKSVFYAKPGDNVKLTIKDAEESWFKNGFVLAGLQYWPFVTIFFVAEVQLLQFTQDVCFTDFFSCIIHVHTATEQVEVQKVFSLPDEQGNRRRLKELKANKRGIVIFKSKNPMCLERSRNVEKFGTFLLRTSEQTIGIGWVKMIKPLNQKTVERNLFFEQKGVDEG